MDGFIGSIVALVARELTLFAAIGMLAGGADDLAIDLLWLIRHHHRRRTVYARFPRTIMATLPQAEAPGRIAIFIPAWRESAVIGPMLHVALGRLRHGDYRIYVGTYPNDPETAQAVCAVGDRRVRLVPGALPGPTSKAECLTAAGTRCSPMKTALCSKRTKAVPYAIIDDGNRPRFACAALLGIEV